MGIFSRLKGAGEALGEFGTGALKGIAEAPREFAKFGEFLGEKASETRIGRAVGEKVIKPTLGRAISPQGAQELKAGLKTGIGDRIFEPRTSAERAGFATEKLGEFFVPGGAATKLGKAAAAAPRVARFGARFAPKLAPKAAGAAARVGTEVAGAVGLTGVQTGDIEEAKEAGVFAAATPIAFKALGGVFKAGLKPIKTIASRLSGVPTAAIERAFRNPVKVQEAFRAAARGEGGIEEVAKKTRGALDDLIEVRSTDFRSKLQAVKAQDIKVKITPQRLKEITDSSIRKFLDKPKGVINIEQSVLRGQKNKVNEISDLVSTWEDRTPLGINELRKTLNTFNISIPNDGAEKTFNAFLKQVTNDVDDFVSKAVPSLKKANTEFSKRSNVIDRLKDELSIKPNTKESTLRRKLNNALNPKSEVYREFIEELGEKSGKDLLSDIAGLTMAKFTPEGFGAMLSTGLGISGVISANPATLALIPLASPRILGEVVTNAGKALSSNAANAFRQAVTASRLPAEALVNNFVDLIKEEGIETQDDRIEQIRQNLLEQMSTEEVSALQERVGDRQGEIREDKVQEAKQKLQGIDPAKLEQLRQRLQQGNVPVLEPQPTGIEQPSQLVQR